MSETHHDGDSDFEVIEYCGAAVVPEADRADSGAGPPARVLLGDLQARR